MNINEFLKKHQLNISLETQRLSEQGIKIMRKSHDELHTEQHVFDIIDLLDEFLRYEKSLRKEYINFEVLIPAICWHDVWKASKQQTGSLYHDVFYALYDGLGSKQMFRNMSRNRRSSQYVENEISFAIANHPNIVRIFLNSSQILKLPHQRIEARILRELDSIDTWNLKRWNYFIRENCNKNKLFYNKKIGNSLKRFYLIYKKDLSKFFTYSWTQAEYQRKSMVPLAYCEELLKINNIKRENDPLFIKPLKLLSSSSKMLLKWIIIQ